MNRIYAFLIAGVLLVFLSGGCGTEDNNTELASPDSLEVATTDTVASLPPALFPPLDSTLFATSDTVRSDTVSTDTVSTDTTGTDTTQEASAALLAMMDSMRSEMAQMRGSVAAMQRATDSLLTANAATRIDDAPAQADTMAAARDTTMAAARDTTAVVRSGENARQKLRYIGLRIIAALIVILLTYYLIRGLVWLLDALAERNPSRRLFFKKLIPALRIVVWSTAFYIIADNIFLVNQQSLVAASAALGIGIGLAAQDTLKNIIGGLLILLDQPFQVGDKINVGGTYGEVVNIGLRSTRITTPDDNLVTVPNAQVVDGQVSNANAGALDCQVVTDLYLPGWVDVMKAKQIAYHAAANSKFVYLEKPIVVIVKDEFKETFLTHLMVKAYVLDTRYEAVFMSDVTEMAKTEFLRHGMLFPMGRSDFAPPTNGTRKPATEDDTV